MQKNRIAFSVLFFGAVFFAPWWLLVLLALVGTFWFSRYHEVVVAGVFYDLLYGGVGYGAFGLGGIIGLVSSVLLLLLIERVKQEIRT